MMAMSRSVMDGDENIYVGKDHIQKTMTKKNGWEWTYRLSID